MIHTHVVEGLDSTNKQNAPTRVHIYTQTRVHIHVYVYIYTYLSALDDLTPIFEQLRVFRGTFLDGAAANRTKQEQEQLARADKTDSHPTRGCQYRGPQRGGQQRGLPAKETQHCQRWPSREEIGIHERTHKGPAASSWTKPEWAAISNCEH